MALMLRFLGIPARVAAGFTSGKYENGGWTVTDHNAHTWVEVWFPGYGWLAVRPDPRPRQPGANYSASSSQFNAGDAASALRPAGRSARAARASCGGSSSKEQLGGPARGPARAGDDGGHRRLLAAARRAVRGRPPLIGGVKLARRRARYLTRDPRRLAGAARRELAEFLADQRSPSAPSATPDELRELIRSELGARRQRVHGRARRGAVRPAGREREAAAARPRASCARSCA